MPRMIHGLGYNDAEKGSLKDKGIYRLYISWTRLIKRIVTFNLKYEEDVLYFSNYLKRAKYCSNGKFKPIVNLWYGKEIKDIVIRLDDMIHLSKSDYIMLSKRGGGSEDNILWAHPSYSETGLLRYRHAGKVYKLVDGEIKSTRYQKVFPTERSCHADAIHLHIDLIDLMKKKYRNYPETLKGLNLMQEELRACIKENRYFKYTEFKEKK